MMILDGGVGEEHSVVIKFYAPHCQYCLNLADYYKEIANSYNDVLFYAFNMEDDNGELEQKYGFYGIPTLFHIKTGGKKTKVTLMPDPDDPNEHTWYRTNDIKEFIDKHK
jgi:thiol-disulfide isomerase/thioredoxin|tara:strand:- start:1336 stop:1665 length:330 start_codon:yes stop_codon:yes gene_type:complete